MSRLNHSPAKVIRQLLVDLALVTDPDLSSGDWPCYVGHMPENPDDAVAIYNTTGRNHGRTHPDGETIRHQGIQVKTRSNSPNDAYDKIAEIVTAFDEDVLRTQVVYLGSIYLVQAVHSQGDILDLGMEVPTSRRRLYTSNAIVSLHLVGTTGTGT